MAVQRVHARAIYANADSLAKHRFVVIPLLLNVASTAWDENAAGTAPRPCAQGPRLLDIKL